MWQKQGVQLHRPKLLLRDSQKSQRIMAGFYRLLITHRRSACNL